MESTAAPQGPYAEAVDTFFDRLRELLPVYVSPMRATVVSVVATAVVAVLLTPALRYHARRLGAADVSPEGRMAAGATLAGAALALAVFASTLRNVLFRMDMVGSNRLHFALEHWITRYVRAARLGASSLLPP